MLASRKTHLKFLAFSKHTFISIKPVVSDNSYIILKRIACIFLFYWLKLYCLPIFAVILIKTQEKMYIDVLGFWTSNNLTLSGRYGVFWVKSCSDLKLNGSNRLLIHQNHRVESKIMVFSSIIFQVMAVLVILIPCGGHFGYYSVLTHFRCSDFGRLFFR